MKPKTKQQRALEPRYSHLLELLDRAASLRRGIQQAEDVLGDCELSQEEKDMLCSVLEASRERLVQITSALQVDKAEAVEVIAEPAPAEARQWSEHELLEVSTTVADGSQETEREVVNAIENLGRSLKLSARSSIETFLSHPSSLLRATSMKVLALHWRLRDYTDRVLWSLEADVEPDCRRAAALCLGSLYEGTRDREIGHELAAVLEKEDEEQDIRWASYYALLDVEGRKPRRRPLPTDEFSVSRDVDPKILAKYRRD